MAARPRHFLLLLLLGMGGGIGPPSTLSPSSTSLSPTPTQCSAPIVISAYLLPVFYTDTDFLNITPEIAKGRCPWYPLSSSMRPRPESLGKRRRRRTSRCRKTRPLRPACGKFFTTQLESFLCQSHVNKRSAGTKSRYLKRSFFPFRWRPKAEVCLLHRFLGDHG